MLPIRVPCHRHHILQHPLRQTECLVFDLERELKESQNQIIRLLWIRVSWGILRRVSIRAAGIRASTRRMKPMDIYIALPSPVSRFPLWNSRFQGMVRRLKQFHRRNALPLGALHAFCSSSCLLKSQISLSSMLCFGRVDVSTRQWYRHNTHTK